MQNKLYILLTILMVALLTGCHSMDVANSDNGVKERIVGEHAMEEDIELILSRDVFVFMDEFPEVYSNYSSDITEEIKSVEDYKIRDIINDEYFDMDEVIWKYSYIQNNSCMVCFIGKDLVYDIEWNIEFLWDNSADNPKPMILVMTRKYPDGMENEISFNTFLSDNNTNEEQAMIAAEAYSATLFCLTICDKFENEDEIIEQPSEQAEEVIDITTMDWNYFEFAQAPFDIKDFWDLQEVDESWYDNGIFSSYISTAYPEDEWEYVADIYPEMVSNPYDYSGFQLYIQHSEEAQRTYWYLVPISPMNPPEVYAYDTISNSMKLVWFNGECLE